MKLAQACALQLPVDGSPTQTSASGIPPFAFEQKGSFAFEVYQR
jgi:hypothetical protein